jgi:hypothetical protein
MKKLRSYRLDEATIADLKYLKEILGASSDTDVIRRALVLMAKVKQNENQGGSLVFVSDDGQRKSVIFI